MYIKKVYNVQMDRTYPRFSVLEIRTFYPPCNVEMKSTLSRGHSL